VAILLTKGDLTELNYDVSYYHSTAEKRTALEDLKDLSVPDIVALLTGFAETESGRSSRRIGVRTYLPRQWQARINLTKAEDPAAQAAQLEVGQQHAAAELSTTNSFFGQAAANSPTYLLPFGESACAPRPTTLEHEDVALPSGRQAPAGAHSVASSWWSESGGNLAAGLYGDVPYRDVPYRAGCEYGDLGLDARCAAARCECCNTNIRSEYPF
jgi:hypothetical protein